MNYAELILGNRIGLLCFIFLFDSCTSTPVKTTPKVYTVEIKQMQFQPAALKVQKNDTVVFINRDMVAHNVTEASNKSWSSSSLPPGKPWRLVVTKSAAYYCSIHPVMKGSILVQ